MNLFFSDLDNTLIYSYKHNIGNSKILVEKMDEKELSYMTEYSYNHLYEISQKYTFIPITTRSIQQYQRINFGFVPRYALTSNGGNLLIDNIPSKSWYNESLEIISDSKKYLSDSKKLLLNDSNITMEVRYVDELFIFTKSSNPDLTIENIRLHIDNDKVDIFSNSTKVYVVPKVLSKGFAILRMKEFLGINNTFCSGDSLFDVSMINQCDISFIPQELKKDISKNENLYIHKDDSVFSDFIINKLLSY